MPGDRAGPQTAARPERLEVEMVPVTAETGSTPSAAARPTFCAKRRRATLSRRAILDFSIPTFVSGAGLAIREGGPTDIPGLAEEDRRARRHDDRRGSWRTLEEQKVTAEIAREIS